MIRPIRNWPFVYNITNISKKRLLNVLFYIKRPAVTILYIFTRIVCRLRKIKYKIIPSKCHSQWFRTHKNLGVNVLYPSLTRLIQLTFRIGQVMLTYFQTHHYKLRKLFFLVLKLKFKFSFIIEFPTKVVNVCLLIKLMLFVSQNLIRYKK